MRTDNLWVRAKKAPIQTTEEIRTGFDIGFDERSPQDTQKELRAFVDWVEANFLIPITLWVDFEYKHYLVKKDGERVGFLFYWADYDSYPVFRNKEDIPQIRLPVRTEHSTIEEILGSFVEAITDYFAWICNEMEEGFVQNQNDVEEVLQAYLQYRRVLGMQKSIVTVIVDRPMGTFHPNHPDLYYSVNYGYIPGTLASDGEEEDVYILGVDEPVSIFTGWIIALIHREDDVEDKWVVAPEGITFTEAQIRAATYFQEQYFHTTIRLL
jgi:inorganic pyrophosphatase